MNGDMLAGKKPQGGFSSSPHINKSKFNWSSSPKRCHLPEDIIFEIMSRLPAKSVATFKCVSTAWLSITTETSFILSHARRARKSFIVRSISTEPKSCYHNKLFSFNTSGSFGCIQRLYQFSDFARSSCDGLVLFLKKKPPHPPSDTDYYVMNPLTHLSIDLPQLNTGNRVDMRMELYYHRWTGEYRLLKLSICLEPLNFHLDAEVLSLGCTSSSWRQILAKVPVEIFFGFNSQIQMNDHLYWTYHDFIKTPPSILVFDILKETFSLMEFPSYRKKPAFPSLHRCSCLKFGLVDIEGILCLWFVFIGKSCIENVKNVMIDVWEAVDGNEKWKNTYSLCLGDEFRWKLLDDSPEGYDLIVCCLCFKGRELMFLFNGPHYVKGQYVQYLFHWNLKSGKYQTMQLPSQLATLNSQALIYKETFINPPALSHATLTLTGSPT